MTKLHDHLGVLIGTQEDNSSRSESVYQLTLPFDQVINLEVRVGPKRADAVQIQVQLRSLAS